MEISMAVLEAAKNGTVDAVVYDLAHVTARQINGFFAAARENNVEAQATFLTQVVKHLPGGRDASKVDTYLDMPYYGEFTDLIEGMVEASKNVRAR
jgi:hypothetical protein